MRKRSGSAMPAEKDALRGIRGHLLALRRRWGLRIQKTKPLVNKGFMTPFVATCHDLAQIVRQWRRRTCPIWAFSRGLWHLRDQSYAIHMQHLHAQSCISVQPPSQSCRR